MITEAQYFHDPRTGKEKPHTEEQAEAARDLLRRVNALLLEVHWHWPTNPNTGTCISGSKGGAGDGAFRAANSKTGGPRSRHRITVVVRGVLGAAVDAYDPKGDLNKRITDALLERHGLYREHPDYTPTWCHLETGGPPSGRRTYLP